MIELVAAQEIEDGEDVIAEDADASFISLSDPDITVAELDAIDTVLVFEDFEWTCRRGFRGGVRGLCRPQICGCGAERHDRAFDYACVLWDWPWAGGDRLTLFVPGNGPCDQSFWRAA
jgi:hypothetical protein